MPHAQKLSALSFEKVTITKGYWARAQETNAQVTLPIEYQQCQDTGRIEAFKLDWTPDSDQPKPHFFWDSDVAKWLEGAAYSLAHHLDAKLEKQVDAVIDLIVSAQQPDGYLNIYFTAVEPNMRWANLRVNHELYCAGHLMEAAVAYYHTTGKAKFLETMCRYANYIDTVFGSSSKQKRGYPGHQEIELALVKLYRTTGEKRYLNLAKFFIDERGQQPYYFDIEAQKLDPKTVPGVYAKREYNQAHLPVREQTEVVGHAVRAFYMYSGMADVAVETGDESLLMALRTLWDNAVNKRMYITGGIGPTSANEGFTFDYDLPNETAYAETCAAIALVFLARRMIDLEAEAKYADEMERALYNGVMAGVSLSGDGFFYANPLTVYPKSEPFLHGPMAAQRQGWFDCACCPPNIARLIASVSGYMYSTTPQAVYVHLYAESIASLTVAEQTVRITQKTAYPWQETITFTVDVESPAIFTLALRIPGWCGQAQVQVNDELIDIAPVLDKGYAKLERQWQTGDQVTLTLPMPVERVQAHPQVRMNAGLVALQRGPVVYCVEEVDNGANLHNLVLGWETDLQVQDGPPELGGVPVITGLAQRLDEAQIPPNLYRASKTPTPCKTVSLTAVPYAYWGNRQLGEMRVWLRTA